MSEYKVSFKASGKTDQDKILGVRMDITINLADERFSGDSLKEFLLQLDANLFRECSLVFPNGARATHWKRNGKTFKIS